MDTLRMEAPHRDVLVKNSVIEAVESPGSAAPDDAVPLDASDRLLIPGLINTHTHGHGSLGRGQGDRWTLELLLNAGPWISGQRTLEDKRLAAQLNAAEMVLKGCTACYDLYFEFPTPSIAGIDAVADGYRDIGMRAVIAPMAADRSLYEAIPELMETLPDGLRQQAESLALAPAEATLEASRALLENWRHDRDVLSPAIAPTIPQHCSDEFLLASRDMARDYGVGLHMHLAESKVQAQVGKARYGKTQTAHLHDLGLLGPNFVGAHCVWLEDDDVRRMADTGSAITHQPGCNLRIGSGIAPVRKFIDADIAVGIGTDGSNASDNQNMFEAIRLAANVSRVMDADHARWISAPEALAIGTLGGARLLGYEGRLGRIERGYLADIVFLDLGSVNYVPLNDPVRQLVNCEDATAVDTVMIDGRIVVKGKSFTAFDFPKLRRDVESAMQRLNETTMANRALAEQLEPLVASYCSGLARAPYPVRRTLHCLSC